MANISWKKGFPVFPIYVISIPTAKERRGRIQDRLDALDLKFVWVDAIDTRGLEQGSGVIGCYKSHLLAYSRLLESEAESCLIFEDDAVLDSEIAGFLGFIRMAAKEIDLIFLEDRHPHKPNLPIGLLGGDRWICLKRFGGTGACAYTINRRAAARILRHHQTMTMDIDVLLHSWWRTGLLAAHVLPVLADHDHGESQIGRGGRECTTGSIIRCGDICFFAASEGGWSALGREPIQRI